MTPPVPVGPFELTGVLGRGGMGEVWSGVHRELGEPVAVKVLTSNRARDPDFIDAFAGEVRAVAALDHPRVVRVHDYGRIPAGADEATEGQLVQGSPWLAMELVPGGSLSDHLARGWMSWGQQRGVLLGLLEALAHAHARGLVHRDLKPGNVLLGDPGRPGETLALADFGLAQAGEERELSGQTEQATGTPHFMAPEQFEGHWRDYGPWTDLYALGCVAFRMATGALPFVGESLYTVAFAHLTGARQAWEPRTPVPVGLEGWIDRLLRRAPGERFQRAADAAWALEQMDGGLEDRVGWPEGEPSVEAEEAPTIPSLRLASDTRMLSARTLVQEPTLPSGPPPPARPDERFTAYPPLPGHWKRPRGSRRTAGGLPGAGLGLFGLRRLPLVGRARELSLLWAALAEVRRTGEARVAVLRGGPGVGKSRLAESFAQRADEVGSAVVLHARHTREVDPGSGLGPMLSRLLQCRGLSEDDVRARASRLLESLGEPDPYEIDGLSEVMAPSSEGGDAGFAFGNPAERHRLMRRVLGRMAAGRPLVLRLDDVQHGGDALRFVRSALDAATDEPVPMLLVATLRDEELSGDEADLVAGLCRRPEVRELTLGPLHRDEQRRLVDSLLGLSSDLGDQVATRTAGNPLFAVQVVGDWVERGVLVATRRGFELAGGAEPALPDSVREVWAQRLATALQGAASDARSSLYVAAALGGQVDVQEWTEACGRAGTSARSAVVDRLVEAGLAQRQGLGDTTAASWSFAQALFRETLVDEARREGREAACHVACVGAIEALVPHGRRGRAARLGGHLAAAGRPGLALTAWHEAATEDLEAAEYARCGDALGRADEAADAAALPPSDERRGDVASTRITWLRHQVRLDEAEEVARAWRARARQFGWRRLEGRFLADLADITHRTGRLEEAETLLEEQRRVEADDGEPAHRIEAQRVHASIARIRGDLDRASALLEEVVAWLRDNGRPAKLAGALRDLAMVRIAAGDTAAGIRLTDEARRLYEAVGFRMGAVRCLNTLGTALATEGRVEEAVDRYEEGLAIDLRIGTGLATMFALNLGMAELRRGRLAEAGERIEPYRAAFQDGPDAAFRRYFIAVDLAGRVGRGDYAGWRADVDELLDLLSASPGGADEDFAFPVHVAAEAAAEAGRDDVAAALIELAVAGWSAMGRADELARARALQARLG